jgi:hypothetical protein
MTMRERRIRAALLALLIGSSSSAPSAATVFGDWTLRDWPDLGCGLEFIAYGRATGVALVEVIVLPQGDGADLLIRVPTGARLVDGIAYRHRSAVTGLHWQSCSATRCTAHVRIDAAEVARLKAGREIIVAYRPALGVPALNVPVSLTGITRGMAAARACQRPESRG